MLLVFPVTCLTTKTERKHALVYFLNLIFLFTQLIVLISWHNDRKTSIYKAKSRNATDIEIKRRERRDRGQRMGEDRRQRY
jgi:hypothetical protein